LPMVVRIAGGDVKNMAKLFAKSGIIFTESMKDSISKIVDIVKMVE
jgi:hypothetical protein